MIDCTLTILAGGRSSRMGESKARLALDGEPILRRLMNRLAWPGDSTLVLAPGMELPDGSERVTHVVFDPVSDQGPLRGILTGLQHAGTSGIIVIPIDMPALAGPHLAALVDAIEHRPEALGMMFSRMVGTDRVIEPFPSAFRIRSAGPIEKLLSEGRGALRPLMKLPGFETADAPTDWNETVWANLNTPEELKRFLESKR